MAQSDPQTRMSVEEYLAFERNSELRHEYIDGSVYALAGGTLNHSTICLNLGRIIGNALLNKHCRAFTSDAQVLLPPGSRYVYPDLSISCHDQDLGTEEALTSPSVIFEVLSPGTELYDRTKKFDYYRQHPTIEEYVLISSQDMTVDIFRRSNTPHLWTYHPFRDGDLVSIACIQVEFPLADLYANVRF